MHNMKACKQASIVHAFIIRCLLKMLGKLRAREIPVQHKPLNFFQGWFDLFLMNVDNLAY